MQRATKRDWYHHGAVIALFLVCFWPVGLVLLWTNPRSSIATKLIVSSLFGALGFLFVLGTIVGAAKKPTAATNTERVVSADSTTDPATVCSWLADAGFATRGWKEHKYEEKWACSSEYRELGGTDTIAYYVNGTADAAVEAHVTLNAVPTASRAPLLSACTELIRKATGSALPVETADAILNATPGVWSVGGKNLSVLRSDPGPGGTSMSLKCQVDVQSSAAGSRL